MIKTAHIDEFRATRIRIVFCSLAATIFSMLVITVGRSEVEQSLSHSRDRKTN